MAETPDGQEKTEQPTGRRLSKARNEGQVAKSQEINFVAGLFAALIYFSIASHTMVDGMTRTVHRMFALLPDFRLNTTTALELARNAVTDLMIIVGPFLLVLCVAAIISNVSQFGILFSTAPMRIRFGKFNPITGLKNLFSLQRVMELAKSIVKLLVIGIVPYLLITSELEQLPLIMDMTVQDILGYIGSQLLRILLYVGLSFVLLAITDFVFQRWKYKRDLMMTKEEVKDEFRQTEGDPLIKSKIRSKQMALLRKIMLDKVPKADVVVTNPVHVAVALQYDRTRMEAPQVVAKGARLIAERIKQIAREHGVPIVENKPLAQSLYKMVDVGQTIPETLYKAVAEVLAYVYTRRQRAA
ncbi:MAG: flagellar biosynthesis protein FlhB [Desulfobacterota bacterium]|nr:flagellar biosynthesis protein FlhB [Thermodesulfobacteriota bacterium]